MSTLNIGLIGCGQIAQLVHFNLITRPPDVKLVAIAESDPQRRSKASRLAAKAIAFASFN